MLSNILLWSLFVAHFMLHFYISWALWNSVCCFNVQLLRDGGSDCMNIHNLSWSPSFLHWPTFFPLFLSLFPSSVCMFVGVIFIFPSVVAPPDSPPSCRLVNESLITFTCSSLDNQAVYLRLEPGIHLTSVIVCCSCLAWNNFLCRPLCVLWTLWA